MKTAEITIAGRTLKLSPLAGLFAAAFWQTIGNLPDDDVDSLPAAVVQKHINDRLAFVFFAARKHHPDLTLGELTDEATFEEACSAILALGRLQKEQKATRTICYAEAQ